MVLFKLEQLTRWNRFKPVFKISREDLERIGKK